MSNVIQLFKKPNKQMQRLLDYQRLPMNGFKFGDKVIWDGVVGEITVLDWTPGELYPIEVCFKGVFRNFTATGFAPESNCPDEQLIVLESK